MEKVKLFVDGHWFDDLYQSTCVFLRGLYIELILDDRFDIYMAAVNTDQLRKVFGNTDRIKYLQYRSRSKYYRLAVDAPRLIKSHGIDVCHFQYISPMTKSCREIVTIHDILFKDFPNLFPWRYRVTKDFLFRRSAKRADLVTTVSQFSHEAIIKYYGINPEKLKVFPNGIAREFFKDVSEANPAKTNFNLDDYILYVSRIEPRKNHLALLKAYVKNRLWEQGLKLVFVGRTDIKVDTLESYKASLPMHIRQNIVELTNVSFDNLIGLYRNATLFVYPSLAEGFGIPPLEAAALKTKTLCSNSTAMSDFAFFEEDLFDPTNLVELSEKMLKRLKQDDPVRRDSIAKLIGERFDWRVIAQDFAASIYSVVRKQGLVK